MSALRIEQVVGTEVCVVYSVGGASVSLRVLHVAGRLHSAETLWRSSHRHRPG